MPHYSPDYVLNTAEFETSTEPVRIFGGSAIGSAHRVQQLPCQDAFRFITSEGRICAVVSDGVSSARLADMGAQIATDAGIEVLSRMSVFDPDQLVAEVNNRLLTEARRWRVDPVELACTFAALSFDVRQDKGMFVSVGDSAVMALQPPGQWRQFHDSSRPDSHQGILPIAGDETTIRHQIDRVAAAGDVEWPAGRVLFLMTDGVIKDLGASPDLLAQQWLEAPGSVPEFRCQLLYERPYSTDDRTVVGLWRNPVSDQV